MNTISSYLPDRSARGRPCPAPKGLVNLLLFVIFFIGVLDYTLGFCAEPTYRVGIYQNPPKVFIDADGKPKGFFVDILNHIAQSEGWKLEYVPCVWSECLEQIKTGELDLLMDVAYTEARGQHFSFNKVPVIKNWAQIFTRKDRQIRSPASLDGKTVALLDGDVHARNFGDLLRAFGANCKVQNVNTYHEGFRAVARRQVDAAVVNNLFGIHNATIFGLEATPIIFSPVDLHFISGKNRHANMLASLDKYLSEAVLDKGSFYQRAANKWLHKTSQWEIPSSVYWVIGLLIGFLVILSGAFTISRRTIQFKTLELNESEKRYKRLLKNQAMPNIYMTSLVKF